MAALLTRISCLFVCLFVCLFTARLDRLPSQPKILLSVEVMTELSRLVHVVFIAEVRG